MEKPIGWFVALGFVMLLAASLPLRGAIRAKLDDLQEALIGDEDDFDSEDGSTWPIRESVAAKTDDVDDGYDGG